MTRAIIWTLAAVFALSAAGGAGAQGRAPHVRRAAQWTVAVHTSGGLAGIGRGTVSISSDGKVVVEPATRGGQPARRCVSRLSADDLAAVRAALDHAGSADWDGKTFGPQAADAMAYALVLTVHGRAPLGTTWYDNTADALPSGLATLRQAVEAAWQKSACPQR